MHITDYIPRGRDQAVSRQELARRTGLPDRENRKLIEQARAAGEQIVSSSAARGYYIADSAWEWEQFVREQERRARTLEKQVARYRAGESDLVFVRGYRRRRKGKAEPADGGAALPGQLSLD